MIRKHRVVFIALAALTVACDARRDRDVQTSPEDVVEIVARGLVFEAPDSLPSGWTTFRLRNESDMIHFALIERLPDGRTIDDHQREVAPVFQQGMNRLNEGDPDGAMAAFGQLPEWFGGVEFFGGPGLTSPGGSVETTVDLRPGTYLIECYVKTNNVFHSFNPDTTRFGMVHQVTVTDAPSARAEPRSTMNITISRAAGIQAPETSTAGDHVVAIRFEDQGVHENFVGHDVHLVRIDDDADMSRVVAWMDWTRPGGLETPAPAEFVGGLNEMAAGSTGYLHLRLEPGRYAWIAEVPAADEKRMLRIFDVPGEQLGAATGGVIGPATLERRVVVR